MRKRISIEKIVVYSLIGLAFVIWTYLFRDFFLFKVRMGDDGNAYYRINTIFWENMIRGIYPMWEFYRDWGVSFGLDIRFIGEFNPFHIVPIILLKLGVPVHYVYFFYAYTYYFIGIIGFFLLVQYLLKDISYAFVASLLYLFSSLGINVFFNYCEIVISVCAIWFFYFFVRFFSNYDRASFVGLIFASMLILITYMPFHFLTIFLAAIFFYFICKPKKTLEKIALLFKFIRRYKVLTIVCIIALFISALPGAIWYFSSKTGDITVNYRQLGTSGKNVALVGKNVVRAGGLLGPLTFERLFSGFKYIKDQISYFYLSVFCYLILGISAVTRITKNKIIYFCVGLTMFLMSLTYSSGIHGFFYDHVYFFKLYRNVYYLLQLALPFIILFIVSQLKDFLEINVRQERFRYFLLIYNFLIHSAFFVLFISLGNVVITSYITVFISFLFFSLVVMGFLKEKKVSFYLFLFVLIIIHPIEVFTYYSFNAPKGNGYGIRVLRRPVFSYKRPEYGKTLKVSKNAYADSSGMYKKGFFKYVGSFWAERLLRNLNFNVLQKYVVNKFILYDQVYDIGNNYPNWPLFEKILRNKENIALVSVNGKETKGMEEINIPQKYQVISKDSDSFRIVEFDMNNIKIKTNFKKRKFLVYNDNFHSFWQAFRDGQKINLYRANLAFKGVWIEPGEHIIEFKYGSNLYNFIIWSCFVLFYSMFSYCIYLHLKNIKNEFI